jgi:ABC-2 type transport system permease protein
MKNILLILQREYLTRVRKKSFIIMTILGPVLIGAMYGIIFWTILRPVEGKTIQIIDESGQFQDKFKSDENVKYLTNKITLDEGKKKLLNKEFNLLAYIPTNIVTEPKSLKIFAEKSVSLELQSKIENTIEKEIERQKLSAAGITQKVLEDSKVNIRANAISLSENGEKSGSALAATIISYALALIIYMVIFIYGVQVMRSVTEEKTSRIVEVLISSVKPFELMMGKILGVGAVGLTQFALWAVLSFGVTSATTAVFGKSMMSERKEQITKMTTDKKVNDAIKKDNPFADLSLSNINFPLIIGCFAFYFFFGFLMYSSIFAAIGAAVDNDTDTQQFMFPITIPIIIGISLLTAILKDPDGNIAFWSSIIPFTSPIDMMARIPFGVPAWQILLSMALLIGGFVLMVSLAARIYRVGILMYGKKVTFKELGKWLFYKG